MVKLHVAQPKHTSCNCIMFTSRIIIGPWVHMVLRLFCIYSPQDLTSLSPPPFSSSPTRSLSAGTFMANVLYSLEYRARVPSAVLARASKLRASGSWVKTCFISSKLIFSKRVGLGTTLTISPPFGSWTLASALMTSSEFEFAPHLIMKGVVEPVLNCKTFHWATSVSVADNTSGDCLEAGDVSWSRSSSSGIDCITIEWGSILDVVIRMVCFTLLLHFFSKEND